MVTAVVQADDGPPPRESLLGRGFHATEIASTGSSLRRGNVTRLVGAEDGDIALLLELVQKGCRAREVSGVSIGGAVLFVQAIEQCYRL